jgi:hypothetical protein
MIPKLSSPRYRAITCPAGGWVLVGRVPIAAVYERKDGAPLTPKDIETITHCGPGFAREVRARVYATQQEALDSAALEEAPWTISRSVIS